MISSMRVKTYRATFDLHDYREKSVPYVGRKDVDKWDALASTGRKRERMAECSPPNTPRTECDPDLCSDEYGTDDDDAVDDDVLNPGGGVDGQGETAASLYTNPIEVLMYSLPIAPFYSAALISRVLHNSPHCQAPHRRSDEQEDGGDHHYEAAGLEAVLCHDKVANAWPSWFGHDAIVPCAVDHGTRTMLAFKHDTMQAHSAF